MFCTCPYVADGKHMAAVLYKWTEGMNKKEAL